MRIISSYKDYLLNMRIISSYKDYLLMYKDQLQCIITPCIYVFRYGQLSGMVEPISGLFGTAAVVVREIDS